MRSTNKQRKQDTAVGEKNPTGLNQESMVANKKKGNQVHLEWQKQNNPKQNKK